MLGDGTMSTLESNIALISTIPEDMQEQIHTYLITQTSHIDFSYAP